MPNMISGGEDPHFSPYVVGDRSLVKGGYWGTVGILFLLIPIRAY